MEYDRYHKFRQETYQMLGNAKDATLILVVLDSEYGNGSWVNQTGEIPVSKLMRIRSNCCLWSKPDSYSGIGRPRKHNKKFKVNDQTTWWSADETVEIEDSKFR
jgi:hypothetical protein